jgi:hypothetical protein
VWEIGRIGLVLEDVNMKTAVIAYARRSAAVYWGRPGSLPSMLLSSTARSRCASTRITIRRGLDALTTLSVFCGYMSKKASI